MKHFAIKEFACPCCGQAPMDNDLLAMVDTLRDFVGEPLIINSGYRCAKHNKEIGGARNSMHTLGRAVDISCTNSKLRYKILQKAFWIGFPRVEWGTRTWIHLDNAPPELSEQNICFLP